MDPAIAPKPTLLTPEAVEAIPPEPLAASGGVTHRVLWRDASSMAGVLIVERGCRLGTHAHRVNHHHMWVVDGHAVVLGKDVGPGSYVHIPSGVDHDIDASESDGCTVFYLYLRPSGSTDRSTTSSAMLTTA